MTWKTWLTACALAAFAGVVLGVVHLHQLTARSRIAAPAGVLPTPVERPPSPSAVPTTAGERAATVARTTRSAPSPTPTPGTTTTRKDAKDGKEAKDGKDGKDDKDSEEPEDGSDAGKTGDR